MRSSNTRSESLRVDLHGAFIRRTDLSGASLRDANLAGADAANALFRNADFAGARLDGTVLKGADLTGARNLTVEQLSRSIIDAHTLLPDYIDRQRLDQLLATSSLHAS
jgi:uncharacterized protein YjbI with pentapeptide repeats